MTSAENRAVPRRADRPFKFKVNGVEFLPESGAKLHFASKDVDRLTIPGLPNGLVSSGDEVTVEYLDECVFRGTAEKIVDRHGRGVYRVNDVVCEGPWGRLDRLVYRQEWSAGSAGTTFRYSRVILNRSVLGSALTMSGQIAEIAAYAASKCGIAVGEVSVADVCLPADETRDVTCATAIQRTLRFHPKVIVRFDYSGSTPSLVVEEPPSVDADYVASIPTTAREYEYTAHPIAAVDVQTSSVSYSGTDFDGLLNGVSHQVYPPDADVDGLDVLHCFVPLAGGSANASWKTFECETEDIPALTLKRWWKEKHPRLANVATDDFTLSEIGRSSSTYPRIAKSSAAELAEAGLHSEVVTFHCKVAIRDADDEVEDVYLSMDFLTTDATTRRYTWQTGSSSTAAETLPEGLAQALFEQRSGALLNERMTIRLGDALPTLGDACDGLYLQEFDVDCAALTAELHFGHPEHLSVEDLRDLLNGFRARAAASNEVMRTEGGPEEEAEDVGGVKPLSSTEWSPGKDAKKTISKVGHSGKIVLAAEAVPDGRTAQIYTATVMDASGRESEVGILSTEDVDLTGVKSANGIKGAATWAGGDRIRVETDGSTIRISYDAEKTGNDEPKREDNTSCDDHPGGGEGVQASAQGAYSGPGGGQRGGLGVGADEGGGAAAGGGSGGGASCGC